MYGHSCEKIRDVLLCCCTEEGIDPQPTRYDGGSVPTVTTRIQHLLFMVDEIEHGFPDKTLLGATAKAGRWIGWVFREMEMICRETHLFHWDNHSSRNAARADVQSGQDRER